MKPRIGRNSAEIFSAGFREDVGFVLRWNGGYVSELNKTRTVCRISGTPFWLSGWNRGISVLTVGVELLDAVVYLLVATEHGADCALEGEAALGVVEGL